jgi:LemA protein
MEWWGILILVAAIVIIVALLLIWWVKMYNALVAAAQKVKNQWSQIDVQLKRRYDLVPNLVETVKGYAAHEKNTLSDVTMWRTKAAGAATRDEEIDANKGLSAALGRLLVTVESYPELKANANFLDLQAQLSDTENKISMARQFYNDTVQKNNELVQKFPSNIVAAANKGKFKIEKYFENDEASRVAPQVKF